MNGHVERHPRAFSLPHEHGGYLTLAGATIAGVAVAGVRSPALAVGLVAAAAFFARAPLEQLVRGRAARFDVLSLVIFGLVGAIGGAVAGGWRAVAALLLAGAVLTGSLLARRERWHRSVGFEIVGMTALGASAGLIAVAGGASLHVGIVLAIVLGAHAGLAVPLVRSEVRPRERGRTNHVAWLSLAVIGAAYVALFLVGAPTAMPALLPRTLHAATLAMTVPAPSTPTRVGLRETAFLAVVVFLLVWSAPFPR